MILDLGLAVRLIKGLREHTAQTTACRDWDEAGIRAMLTGADGPPGAVLAAAALAAEDASLQLPSPAAIRNHWPVNAKAEAPVPRRLDMCPDHPQTERVHCDRHEPPATPEQIAARMAEVRAALAHLPTPKKTHRLPLLTEGITPGRKP